MPSKVTRIRTKYPGVYFIESHRGIGKSEKIFYIQYRRNGKQHDEKAGRERVDEMTPAKASRLRIDRIEGKELPNRERRAKEVEAKKGKWTIQRLWFAYNDSHPSNKGALFDHNRFDKHLQKPFGPLQPDEITSDKVDEFRIALTEKYKPGTVRNVLELLRRIINFGVKKKQLQELPFTIELPPNTNERTEQLTAEQFHSLLKVLETDGNIAVAAMMKLALFTGMRRGELFKLRWNDIDYENSFITLTDPKGGKDQRIPLNGGARHVFKTYKSQTPESPYVFPGRTGRQKVDVKKAANRIRDRAGLPKDFRPFHGLRHAYASMLASSGEVPMYTLQKLMTHKSPQMTQRYAHLQDEALKKAAGVADYLIAKGLAQLSEGKRLPKVWEHMALKK